MSGIQPGSSMEGRALRGLAAIIDMLNMIGDTNLKDADMARVFCDNEMEIRDAVGLMIRGIARDHGADA